MLCRKQLSVFHDMRAIKSALLTSAGHLSKILLGFCLLKVIALYLGPEGLGALGHFMSAVSIVMLLAGGGVVNGVIKYVAEYRSRPRELLRFISMAASYSLYFVFVVLLLGVLFSKQVSGLLLGSDEWYWVIILLVVAQLGFAFSNIVTGTCNGLRDTETFAKIQIIGNFSALPVIWFLVANYSFAGAAIAIISFFFMCVFPALYFYCNSAFYGRLKFIPLDRAGFRRLSSFSLMLLVSAIAFPVVEIIVREYLIRSAGYAEAGIWQGAIKLSSAYVGFFGVFLAYYFMPLVSSERDRGVISRYVFRFTVSIMGVYLIGALALYAGRAFFIPILLSDDFGRLEDLIFYQLVGDFFKVSAYVFAFVVVAKAAVKLYIVAELIQAILFFCFVRLGVNQAGAESVMVAYMLAYACYFFLAFVSFVIWVRRQI
jgi:polysaccharide transporter, PST family